MPLAAGYLKALIDTNPELRTECDVRILNFCGHEHVPEIVWTLCSERIPDVVCFSVLGWNYHAFGQAAAIFKQVRPDGWVIWGGNHVSHQAMRVFAEWSAVDVIVNGEGEFAFVELMTALAARQSPPAFAAIAGISYRLPDGSVRTTPERPRIEHLDVIPSPILTQSIELTNAAGDFAYDYALIETNRGCPYSCKFCYWGGAIGQKIRAFSIDRLREEVERLASLGAANIMLCDANFGMLGADEEFTEICIRARERYGYPRHIMTSWAKNKGKVFYRIVRRMKENGFHSAFNLALQSLDEPVLEAMGRRNMRINEWVSLAQWLRSEGLDVYAELIWGCPGETIEGFLSGYDRLARHVTRIAVYPHLIMPNTGYSAERARYGLVTWHSSEHDFELVLSHDTMSIADNRRMHRFLFWARVIAEHLYFRAIWLPLFELAELTQSQILLLLDGWIDRQVGDPLAEELRTARDRVVSSLEASSRHIEAGLQCLYARPEAPLLLTRWWREDVMPLVPMALAGFFEELFRFDLMTLPILSPSSAEGIVKTENARGEIVFRRDGIEFAYDVAEIADALSRNEQPNILPGAVCYDVTYRAGFCNDMRLYHNAHNLDFFGKVSKRATTPAMARSTWPVVAERQ
jgi:radical SAM C-methyltransferase